MEIQFYLQADPGFKDETPPVIREYFHQFGGGHVLDGRNVIKNRIDNRGHVDADIVAQHPEAIAKFRALVNQQQDAMYAECRANIGSPVFPKLRPEPELLVEVPKVPLLSESGAPPITPVQKVEPFDDEEDNAELEN